MRTNTARLFPMYMLTNILFFAVLHYGFKAGDLTAKYCSEQ